MMGGIGKQIGEGMKDVGKAVTVDVVKGVGQVAKGVVSGSVETLTGTSSSQSNQQQVGQQETPGGAPSDPVAFEKWKAQKEQAARARLAQLQSQLEGVKQKKQQEKVQTIQVEEQEKVEEKQEVESERQKRKAELITAANRRGGTGEVKQGKF